MKVQKRIGKAAGGLIDSVRGRDNQIMRATDPSMRINPDSATSDRNTVRGNAPANPADNQQGLAKGGKIKAVSGKPVGKDDGMIPAQRGEYVVKKSSTTKYGPAKMAAVNRGTARITKGKR